jgi:hypothetical protein
MGRMVLFGRRSRFIQSKSNECGGRWARPRRRRDAGINAFSFDFSSQRKSYTVCVANDRKKQALLRRPF